MKSILLGIGIGMVLVSIMSMIYASGANTYKELTDDEIKEHARRLGMVHISELVTENTGQNELDDANDNSPSENSATPEPVMETETEPATEAEDDNDNEAAEPAIDAQDNINDIDDNNTEKILVIVKGDTSAAVADKLLAAGLIDSKEAFIKRLYELKLSRSVQVGEFKISSNTDLDTIIKMIT